MSIATAINDNLDANAEDLSEDIVANAVLVATAFRLRDEEALVTTLRRLTASVMKLEAENSG